MKSDLIAAIAPLDKEQWKGFKLPFHFIATEYYDIEIVSGDRGFVASLLLKELDTPFEKMPDSYDPLFAHYWEDVEAWGIVIEDKLCAAIETSLEGWSNRLRVTELWVDDALRRQGIATALMDRAKQRAIEEDCRAMMLETQSNNPGAIAFYLGYGFQLIGFDTISYRNDDIQRREVHLEMGLLLR